MVATTSTPNWQMIVGVNGHVQITDSGILIPATVIGDTGVYMCNAMNNVGSTNASAYLDVIGRLLIFSIF